mmetsp:Transcript_14168/g.38944  ORF Transcript_14168/g.38944 Transcript_14168/m.38944 type:complete len:286 (+) Transcript_14168:3-860(+)
MAQDRLVRRRDTAAQSAPPFVLVSACATNARSLPGTPISVARLQHICGCHARTVCIVVFFGGVHVPGAAEVHAHLPRNSVQSWQGRAPQGREEAIHLPAIFAHPVNCDERLRQSQPLRLVGRGRRRASPPRSQTGADRHSHRGAWQGRGSEFRPSGESHRHRDRRGGSPRGCERPHDQRGRDNSERLGHFGDVAVISRHEEDHRGEKASHLWFQDVGRVEDEGPCPMCGFVRRARCPVHRASPDRAADHAGARQIRRSVCQARRCHGNRHCGLHLIGPTALVLRL